MTSRDVAEAGYRGAARGKRVVVTGLRNKVVVLANRFLSRKRMTKLVRRLQERRRGFVRNRPPRE
jgi:short-subunit dehydrogenase